MKTRVSRYHAGHIRREPNGEVTYSIDGMEAASYEWKQWTTLYEGECIDEFTVDNGNHYQVWEWTPEGNES